MEGNAIEVFHHYVFHLSSFLLDVKFQVLSGKIIIGSVCVTFPHSHVVVQLVVHPLSMIVSDPKGKKLS